jgi:site-specific recombinase XerC
VSEKNIYKGVIPMSKYNLNIQTTIKPSDRTFFTKPEIMEIVSAIKDNYIHLIWFKLLYSFGLNLQELVNLKVKDIDLKMEKITINSGKRAIPRRLDIPNSLVCDLRLHCNQKDPEAFVFPGRNGRLHTRTIQKALEKAESKLCIKLSIAKLRKSIAVHLCQCGWDYKSIGEFLGHANYRATRNLLGESRKFFLKSSLPFDKN